LAKKTDIGVGIITTTIPKFRGYNSIAASENGFWLGYVGYEHQKGIKPRNSDFLAKKIFNFSWDGNPKGQYDFEIPFNSFAIDHEGGKIYCLSFNPEPQVIMYNIN
jgi:hypothetical protein